MSECTGLMGWLFGHRPRVRETVTRYERSGEHGSIKETKREYHGTACDRCFTPLDTRAQVTPLEPGLELIPRERYA